MINPCLKCEHSCDFQKPVSMTTGNHAHMPFTCTKPHYRDAYGEFGKTNTMILDLVT